MVLMVNLFAEILSLSLSFLFYTVMLFMLIFISGTYYQRNLCFNAILFQLFFFINKWSNLATYRVNIFTVNINIFGKWILDQNVDYSLSY